MTIKYNIIRIDGTTKRKHLVHPQLEYCRAKEILGDMAKVHIQQDKAIVQRETSFTTLKNKDLFMVEEISLFNVGQAA